MTKSVLSLLLLLAAAPARAQNSSAGTGGASFLNLGLGDTRAMAMGRAGVAIAEGTDSLVWNPAGLGLTQTKEISYSFLRYVQGINAPLYLAYAHPLGRTVLGANVAYLGVGGFDARDANGVPITGDNVRVQDGFATFSAARSFLYEKLFLGGSLKGVSENNAGASNNNLVVDLGALFKPAANLSLGMSWQNLGGSQQDVAKVFRMGGAVRFFDMLNTSLELSKPSDNGWQAGIGGEFTLPEELLSVGQISFRIGYFTTGNQGTILPQDRNFLFPLVGAQGMTFGLGLFTSQAFGYGIGLDYAMVPLGALGTSDHLTLKVKF